MAQNNLRQQTSAASSSSSQFDPNTASGASVDTGIASASTLNKASQQGADPDIGNIREAPSIAAPQTGSGKGGAGLRSISPTFKINPQNGTLSLGVPINVTSGRGGFGPTLQLSYDSGSGNGPFGIGWNLSTGSVTRKTSKHVPLYDDTDTFVLSDSEDLVPAYGLETNNRDPSKVDGFLIRKYRPRVENSPARIERWTSLVDSSDEHWRTISQSNVTTIYGRTDASRIFETDSSQRKLIFSWLVSETYDGYGNGVEFVYKAEDEAGLDKLLASQQASEHNRNRGSNKYLKSVKYGNQLPNRDLVTWMRSQATQNYLFEVVFDYGEHAAEPPTTKELQSWSLRQDPFSVYTSGFELRSCRLCRRILMFHHMPELPDKHGRLISSTLLGYTESGTGSFLASITTQGHIASQVPTDSAPIVYQTQTLPPTEFEYSKVPAQRKLRLESADTSTLYNVPSNSVIRSQWIDLDADGVPGLLSELKGGAWSYQRNESAANDKKTKFGPCNLLDVLPSMNCDFIFEDFDRNGALDAVYLDPNGRMSGFSERSDGGWTNPTAFRSVPNIQSYGEGIRRIDLTGNGLQDIITSVGDTRNGDTSMVWLQSLGKRGFAQPRPVSFANGGPNILSDSRKREFFIADMSGDGLSDIVHVQPNRISYWPNLGYGRFGAEVQMTNCPVLAPQDQFNYDRVRLADIDGSGPTDVLYLPPAGSAVIYYNLAGNGWGDARTVNVFPQVDNLSAVFLIDLLGAGTSCLCWSGPDHLTNSTRLNYIDLTAGNKPHLMRRICNNLGGSTVVTYKPSTYYSFKDEKEGKLWKTKLPFPVHCVSRTEATDEIAETVSTTNYAYHEGFYDGIEREFRGFAMVEEWSSFAIGLEPSLQMSTQAGTHIKTWYLVGSADAGIAPRFTYSKPLLSSPTLPKTTNGELYEFHRALKGREIRQELYPADTSSSKDVPHVVTETTYQVVPMQSSTATQYGVFQVRPREALTCLYDCDATEDSRIEHSLVLETNDYGDVLKSVNINYGRLKSALSGDEDKKKQCEDIITYVENDFTNPFSGTYDHRKPLPAGSRLYRIIDFPPSKLYDIEQMRANRCQSLRLLPEHYFENDFKASGNATKVVLAATQIRYRSNDLTTPLQVGLQQSRSVLDQSFSLAFTPEIISSVYGSKLTDFGGSVSDLMSSAGYVELIKGEGRWWKPSSRHLFGSEENLELANARQSFYTPTITVDALKQRTAVDLDQYYLLPVKVTDAVGNTTQAKYDPARLKVIELTDANHNRQQFVYDALGYTVGNAIMGKLEERVGDSLDNFNSLLSNEQIASFFKSPRILAPQLLKEASRRTVYDFTTKKTVSGQLQPAMAATISRVTHGSDTNVTVAITYLNGFGDSFQEIELIDSGETFEKTSGKSSAETWRLKSWQICDSAGNPLKQFQPSLEKDWGFTRASNTKVNSTMIFYDGANRAVATLQADNTWTKVVPKPWHQVTYDAGATVLLDPLTDPDVGQLFTKVFRGKTFKTWHQQRQGNQAGKWAEDAAGKSSVYASTHGKVHYDAAGRSILAISGGTSLVARSAHAEYDHAGNCIKQRDTLGRLVEQRFFTYQGQCIESAGMDNGKRWAFYDCLGKPVLQWNSRDICVKSIYDGVGRELRQVLPVVTNIRNSEVVLSEITYGERPKGVTDAEVLLKNLRGRIFKTCDQSGTYSNEAFDFKGNCIHSSRQYAVDYKSILDWTILPALEKEVFKAFFRYDARNKCIEKTGFDGGTTQLSYTLTGATKTVLWRDSEDSPWTNYVTNADYTADDRILRMEYGNGTATTYEYDEFSRQLLSRRTVRDKIALDDLSYSHDILGRITHICDQAHQTSYFDNSSIETGKDFSYDALGQLIQATGRELLNDSRHVEPYDISGSFQKTSIPTNGDRMCRYSETYTYDEAGNIKKMQHSPVGATGWTRSYSYDEPNQLEPASKPGNKLSSTSIGGTSESYGYDQDAGKHGCITKMPGFSSLNWDMFDRLRSSSKQKRDKGVPETTWYVYDHTGTRVRKVVEREADASSQPRKLKDTLILPSYDRYREFSGDGTTISTEKKTIHVSGLSLVALIENGLVRYQANEGLELDDKGLVISYEEYSPFGATTFASCQGQIEANSKYRYAAYERDVETGFFYCGARYYAGWLGRWISCDPLGIIDGFNLYTYVSNDPVNLEDSNGTWGWPKWLSCCFGDSGNTTPFKSYEPRPDEMHVPLLDPNHRQNIDANNNMAQGGNNQNQAAPRGAAAPNNYRGNSFDSLRSNGRLSPNPSLSDLSDFSEQSLEEVVQEPPEVPAEVPAGNEVQVERPGLEYEPGDLSGIDYNDFGYSSYDTLPFSEGSDDNDDDVNGLSLLPEDGDEHSMLEAVSRDEDSMGLSTWLDIHAQIDALSDQTEVSNILAGLDDSGTSPASLNEDMVLTKAAGSSTSSVNASSRPDKEEEKDQDDSKQEDAKSSGSHYTTIKTTK